MRATREPPDGRSAPGRRIVLLLFAVAFGTNVFTPIIVIYRRRLHLSPTAITGIFATYAAGLVVALLFAGFVSDRVGRRRVALPAAALAGVAALLFLPAARAVPLLFLARFVQGVATGAVFSVGSAWLVETAGLAHAAVSARRASVAMNTGFALGPLTAGVLGQFAPAPTALPFLAHVVLVVAATTACWRAPETLRARGTGRLLRLGVPRGRRREFWLLLAPIALCVFVFPSTGIATVPIFVAPRTGAVLFIGLVAAVTLGAAAVVSPAARPLGPRAAPVGLVCGAAGFAAGIVVELTGAWGMLLPGALLLGAASGLCMTAGLTMTQLFASDETRGAVNAAFYTLAYLGFAAPVVVTAAAGEAMTGPYAVLAVLMLLLAGWLATAGRRAVTA